MGIDADGFRVLGDDTPEAVTLGRLVRRGGAIENKIKYDGERHLLTFGPNGSGKGMRLFVPNLLQMTGNRSIVVVDPKGELAAITAPFRRTLGRVVILNPFGFMADLSGYEDLKSEGFNPLLALDPNSPSFNSQAALLADALVSFDPKAAHWDGSALALVAALIMYVVLEARSLGQAPTIGRVRDLICLRSSEARSDVPAIGIPALAEEMMRSEIAGLRNKASQFTDWNREIQSIASTAKRHTEPFDDPEIRDDLARGSFDMRDLKRGPVTIYLVLPPDYISRHAKWLRIVLASALKACMRPRQRGEPRVLFMLDEFFALGHLEIVADNWSLVRGYGVQLWPILQSLQQLHKRYPDDWETFIGSAGAVTSFAPGDMSLAKWLSERFGDTTRTVRTSNSTYQTGGGSSTGSSTGGTGSTSTGNSKSWSSSFNTTSAPLKVPLITAHQLLGLEAGYSALFLSGVQHGISTKPIAYWNIEECKRKARANPYYLG